eukprot:1957873-Alexandrium_andersonii.AAC.1
MNAAGVPFCTQGPAVRDGELLVVFDALPRAAPVEGPLGQTNAAVNWLRLCGANALFHMRLPTTVASGSPVADCEF